MSNLESRAAGQEGVGPEAQDAALAAATSRAVIDLDAFAHNAQVLSAIAGTPWMAVVKADAYGHGLREIALAALDSGASWLGAAQLSEVLHLRQMLDDARVRRSAHVTSHASPSAPRLMAWLYPVTSPELAAAPSSPIRAALRADIDLSVSSLEQLAMIRAAVRAEAGELARIHVKADTGMSRGGAVESDLPELAAAVRKAQDAGEIHLVGLWSHLSRADEPDSGSTEDHLARFLRADATLREAGLTPDIRHLAATGGALWHPDTRLDLVRLGIGLYGLSPSPAVSTAEELGLRPVMRLEASISLVKRIPAGQPVSYGARWTAPTDRWVALIPLGYSDGIPRHALNAAQVLIAGQRRPVVGTICMDQIVVDLGPATSDIPPAQAGDLAILWGSLPDDAERSPSRIASLSSSSGESAGEWTGTPQGGLPSDERPFASSASADSAVSETAAAPSTPVQPPSAKDWAQAAGTIGYEIVTRLGARIPRVPLRRHASRRTSTHTISSQGQA